MEFVAWERALLALLIVVSASVFAKDLWSKIRLILPGKPDRVRSDRIARRLARVVREVLFQSRVISGRPVAGAMHATVFFGFLFFAFETTDHFLEAFGFHFLDTLLGDLVPSFKIVVTIWAVAVSIAITGLALRRFVFVKYSPDPKSYSSGFVALLILFLMLTFLYSQMDPAAALAKANWWIHALLILVFPWLILRSKHFHLLIAPLTVFLRTHELGELQALDLDIEALEESEEEVTLGLENLATLSRKMRMDFLSCVECRRCTDHCPAHLAGQELDPRAFVLHGREAISTLTADAEVVGNVISETALGQCTSCAACENICPCGIEHLQVLTGAKRAQALATGTGMVASEFLNEIERTGNAFGRPKSDRTKTIDEFELPRFEKGSTEYLLWLGCVWGYNPDAKSSLAAMGKLLDAAGVSYGVLASEPCCGHHSRRQGEEMQFQTLAAEVMESLLGAGVEKIITPCPHCLHTISREYADLDPEFSVQTLHHSRFISGLVSSGKLKLDPSKWQGSTATYHDPCYLGRFEGEFEAPRSLAASSGLRITEMEDHGKRAVCCGGGSAGFVREQQVDKRVDQLRAEHVKDTGARVLVTACPECKMMLAPAAEIVNDVAEVVAEALRD